MAVKVPLVVFDFDHTLLDCNTDVEVRKLSPGGELPEELKRRCKSIEWTDFMQEVFDYLHDQGVTSQQIKEFIRALPFTPGLKTMLNTLTNEGAEMIIISDANSVFISELLMAADITKHFKEVFTNPAVFDETGRLTVSPFSHQTECGLSRPNMCKGKILDDYIATRRSGGQEFSFIAYAGDGINDFCPMLRLHEENSLAFPRIGYALQKHILTQREEHGLAIKAKLIEWDSLNTVSDAISHFLHGTKF